MIAKWSWTFDETIAERHLHPERYPETARADENLADGNLLTEDMNDANPHPHGIPLKGARNTR